MLITMIKNYFKIAWRNLLKHGIDSAINIFGLALGLSCFLLILLYVVDELSFDRFHKNADRIYRVDSDIKFGGNELKLAVCSDPMGATLKKDYPQVEEYARIYASNGAAYIKRNNELLLEEKIAYADSTFFNLFSFPELEGDITTALNEPNTVVISESGAKKYFGTSNAINKTLEVDKTLYRITAVIKDMPQNAHFHFDLLLSMDNLDYQWGNYLSHNFHTYIMLKEGVDYREFEKNFDEVIEKYALNQARNFMEVKSLEEFRKSGNRLNYSLMPLTDIHLHSDRFPELGINSNIQYVYIFGAAAFFILIIACINFINLSTARNANRAREVGIRKVLGTEKKDLISQFLLESTLIASISFVIAIGAVVLALPWFNNLSSKAITPPDLFNPGILPFLIMLPFVVGIIAGSYPAFFLSNFKPVEVLKGKLGAGFKKSNLRSGLVVFQFFTSITLIIGTIIVYNQLRYIQTKNLGFNKDQVVMISGASALGNRAEAFKNEVVNLTGVKSGTVSVYLPGTTSRRDEPYSRETVMNPENALSMQSWSVDYDYVPTMELQIIKGRNFSKEFGSDSSAVIINETAAKVLEFDDPIGKKIYRNKSSGSSTSFTIIGVVKDFNYESLRKNIYPLGLFLENNNGRVSFKVSTDNIQGLIKQIEDKWNLMGTGLAFQYQFLDETFDNLYRTEQRVGEIAFAFAIIAVLIACLGLFGLVTYMAEQRTKEIGIRRVLGASTANVVLMLNSDFLKLVIIAAMVAFPVAWWAMSQWLKDFAYRTELHWTIFVLAGIMALAIAFLTMSLQSVRAAMANPIESLRNQ